ncbi:MAG: hypothetical protein KBT02_06915 [Treponema sp.]|nr:hypothetical protein [Candidatus Treponema caballi]
MRRFFVVVFSVLSVCTCISCSNLSLAKRNTSTGIVFIQILDAYTTSRKAAPVVQEQVDVEKYHIAVIKEEAEDLVFEKEYTPAELDAGVSLDLDAGVYKVCIKAYGSEGILFVGETVEPLTVTLENTPENPAVAEIDMKIVLAIFDNGLYAPVQQVYFSCLEGAILPQFLSVDTTDFPNTWFVEGKVLNGWTDSVNNTNYSISADIDISDKKLPLHLTANWGEPVDPAGGYASSFLDTKYYQSSDVQWNSKTAEGETLSFTVTDGTFECNATCTETEFLKLKFVSQSDSGVTVEIWKYSGDNDTVGEKVGSTSYTISAVTKYGVKLSTPFLFTKEGLDRYYSLTEDEGTKHMNSIILVSEPKSIAAIEDKISTTP